METDTNIRTLKDGSIDYAHYIARSHEIRSNDAHRFLASVWKFVKSIGKSKQVQRLEPTTHANLRRTGPNRAEVRSTTTRQELTKAS